MRTIGEIGDLWPRCKACNHIAQAHNHSIDESIPGLEACSEHMRGQCPTCSTQGVITKCKCKGYVGPTQEEFKKLLTPEEIAKYNF